MDTVKTKTLKVNKHRKRQKQILRKPAWLRSQIPAGENFSDLKQVLRTRSLHTVCEEARCPNLGECWGGGTATFMVMGDTCTRGCRFCAVKTAKAGLTLDPDEPHKVAEAAHAMGLRYVVITSVDRDDLPDGGAAHFAEVIREVYRLSEQKQRRMMIEVLTPDFQGVRADVDKIIAAKPTVFAHNVETTEALTRYVRDARSGYRQSLDVLAYVKQQDPEIVTKSAMMLGLGESEDDIFRTMDDLLESGVQILTLGQYLQPTKKHLAVEEFVTPEKFDALAAEGKKRGFAFVAAGPMVRSSYKAGELFVEHLIQQREQV